LITARTALEQNRDVFAIPGSILSDTSSGPNKLIKDGAIPVTSAEDIFRNFRWHISKKNDETIRSDKQLSADEKSIWSELTVSPIHLDELTRKLDFDLSRTAEVLLNLELKGFILRKPGNYIVRN
jgi:DNA processing protein